MSGRRRALSSASALALLAMAATACDAEEWKRVGFPEPSSEQAHRMLTLWQGTWIAAGAVGVVVLALIIWAVLFHRKRKGQEGLPKQVRYNLPVEMLYTAVPFVIIGVLFFYTARDQSYVEDLKDNPDVTVDVIGYQWSWQFDYIGDQFKKADGTPVSIVGTPTAPDAPGGTGNGEKPVLVLPVNKTVHFNLKSDNVIHSFWVPAFLYKKDVMPGFENQFQLKPTKTGTYEGRCAELCGVDHTRMLFQVKVVTQGEFDAYIAEQKGGGAQ
ncbi:cytochrome c oxidase subunit II [Actinocorallia sp. API 0066]|uniref:aa3-type cytochrome oxidase subunit II n=1 Tax=Actinocorallia sp. API 0066 TaxID=2896846 RepID=UPI001E5EA05D|nr:cytochrome c oxidase subunit II [Actinocorallia sp. API 0066]MCD0450999.1 cytochrome c oxidase subunit II [Actinocorallia sp. API 0066]